MSTLTLAEHQTDILASLRRLKGRGTVGDVVADSGLANDHVRAGLKTLLESHRGHLEVSDSGELLYEFDPDLIERGMEPFLFRARRAITDVITKGFKAWIDSNPDVIGISSVDEIVGLLTNIFSDGQLSEAEREQLIDVLDRFGG